MPICVSYLTNTMPIIGGGGGGGWGQPHFCQFQWKILGNIYADILIFANANVA